jgi:hypothetical protein
MSKSSTTATEECDNMPNETATIPLAQLIGWRKELELINQELTTLGYGDVITAEMRERARSALKKTEALTEEVTRASSAKRRSIPIGDGEVSEHDDELRLIFPDGREKVVRVPPGRRDDERAARGRKMIADGVVMGIDRAISEMVMPMKVASFLIRVKRYLPKNLFATGAGPLWAVVAVTVAGFLLAAGAAGFQIAAGFAARVLPTFLPGSLATLGICPGGFRRGADASGVSFLPVTFVEGMFFGEALRGTLDWGPRHARAPPLQRLFQKLARSRGGRCRAEGRKGTPFSRPF